MSPGVEPFDHPLARWGIGEPVLSIQVGDAVVALRMEVGSEGRTWLVDQSRDGGAAVLITGEVLETDVGNVRVIAGRMPNDAATVELLDSRGNRLATEHAAGVWLGTGPLHDRLTVAFLDSQGNVVSHHEVSDQQPARGFAGLMKRLPALRKRLTRRSVRYGPG